MNYLKTQKSLEEITTEIKELELKIEQEDKNKTKIYYIILSCFAILAIVVLFPILLFSLNIEFKEALKFTILFLGMGSALCIFFLRLFLFK